MSLRLPLSIGSSQGNVGDSLFITPVLRAFPGSTLTMYDNASCRNVAPIYDGLAKEVLFSSQPGTPLTVDAKTHKSQRMLMALGVPDLSIIPEIRLTPEEIAWARAYLAPYANPITFVNNNSGWADPSNHLARHIKPPREIMQALADYYREIGYTILQFGLNPNHWRAGYDNNDPIAGAVQIRGLTIRQLTACHAVIGKTISGDTGDPYLTLATGGRFIMLLCEEAGGYCHHDIVYTPALWKGEKERTLYYRFNQYERVADEGLNWLTS